MDNFNYKTKGKREKSHPFHGNLNDVCDYMAPLMLHGIEYTSVHFWVYY